MPRVIEAFKQFFDGEGDPLIEGKLKFTVSGTNATDKDTYADVNETIANTNPVLLDSEGRAPNIFGSGSYRVTLYSSDDLQISKKDPVPGVSSNSDNGFPSWNGELAYNIPDIVVADDLNLYRSLTNNNKNNNPLASVENWEQIEFEQFYNAYRTYDIGDRVLYDNVVFVSKVSSNLGNTPGTSTTEWGNLDNGFPLWLTTSDYNIPDMVTGSNLNIYRSIIDANEGNDPTISNTAWEQVKFEQVYKSEKTYSKYDRCIDSLGLSYISLADSNLNNAPAANTDKWFRESSNLYTVIVDYNIGDLAIGSDGVQYKTLIANGPSSTVVDPVGDVTSTWGEAIPAATETVAGVAEIATQAESDAITDDERIVTPLKLGVTVGTADSSVVKTALNASGDASIYAARAWVNFNGTGTVAIRASGNVSSITDDGTGKYTVNFTEEMEDINYVVSGVTRSDNAGGDAEGLFSLIPGSGTAYPLATTSVKVATSYSPGGNYGDFDLVSVVVHR